MNPLGCGTCTAASEKGWQPLCHPNFLRVKALRDDGRLLKLQHQPAGFGRGFAGLGQQFLRLAVQARRPIALPSGGSIREFARSDAEDPAK